MLSASIQERRIRTKAKRIVPQSEKRTIDAVGRHHSQFTTLTVAELTGVGGLHLSLLPNFANGVNPAPLAFEIRSGQNFAEQSGAKHHSPGQEQQTAGDREWSVLKKGVVPGHFVACEIQKNETAA